MNADRHIAKPALTDALANYGDEAYLTTISDRGPHTSLVQVSEESSGTLSCNVGKTAATNIQARDTISLLWIPPAPGDYFIVMNAQATLEEDGAANQRARFQLTKAVMHRPGTNLGSGPCASDCIALSL